MSKPLYVISCPYDTYSGYGARARDYVQAVIDTGKYEVKLMAQRWGATSWGFCQDHPEWKHLLDLNLKNNKLERKPDIWTQITIPNEFQKVGTLNIGVTAGIESTACAQDWIEGLNRMDVTFVSSQHSKNTFVNTRYQKINKETKVVEGEIKLEKPIEVLFEGYNTDLYKKINEVNNINLDEIPETFAYLFVGHWIKGDHGHDRKNVSVLVKSFYETFKNKKKKPALILKTTMGAISYISRDQILDKIKAVRRTVNSTDLPNIYVLTGELSDAEVNELYNHKKVKAMVNLTKGEGFGRPLLEFATTGKPIIASGWSGHVDFLKPETSILIPGKLEQVHKSAANKWLLEQAKWFTPDSASVGKALNDVFLAYPKYLTRSKKQVKYVQDNFSFNAMKDLLDIYLDRYASKVPQQVELKLPKLEKIS